MRFQMIVLRRLIGTLPTARLLDHSILMHFEAQPTVATEELSGRKIFERDLLVRLCSPVRVGSSRMDHHAMGRSCTDAQRQGDCTVGFGFHGVTECRHEDG